MQSDATVEIVTTRKGKTRRRQLRVLDPNDHVIAVFLERQDKHGNGKGVWYEDRFPAGSGRNRFNFYTFDIRARAFNATNRHKGIERKRLP